MVVPAKLSRLVCDREKSLLTIVVDVACPDYDPGNQCKSLMLYEASSWAIAVESVVVGSETVRAETSSAGMPVQKQQ